MAIELHALFGAHAVLQRERPIPVYGLASPGARVEVELAGHRGSAVADDNGHFIVTLDALGAGGPHVLQVRSGGDALTVEDVLIGDVWLCSGQSNMQWEVAESAAREELLDTPEDGELRLLYVPLVEGDTPERDLPASWQRSTRTALIRASGVGAFFARKLRRELGVPVGLWMASWGGTRIASWLPEERLETQDRIPNSPMLAKPHISREYVLHDDPGNQGQALGFAEPAFDDSGWRTQDLPSMWQEQGEEYEYNGAVWFRRRVELPEALRDRDLVLELGAVDDFDVTYVNGARVGETGSSTLNAFAAQRRYLVPKKHWRPGPNLIAVRVFDHYGMGGFPGPKMRMRLSAEGVTETLPLSGTWRAFTEHRLLPWRMAFSQASTSGPYNAMIHPLARSACRGVLFYQGESDVSRAAHYRALFRSLIESWRALFRDDALPFLFVQLANFEQHQPDPADNDWAELRESQRLALSVPNTGMAVAIDVGDANDIHPRDKKSVGERLALWALARVYGRELSHSGPLFRSARRQGTGMLVEFDHAAGLRARGGGKLQGFAIAGADQRFVWAEASISGQSVLVSSPLVPEPVAVRYGWAMNPEVNLENDAALPASPFRSDDFELSTHGVR